MTDESPKDVCDCGHPRDAHEHYRAGTDCGVCGKDGCAQFTPAAASRPDPGDALADPSDAEAV